MYKLLAVNKIWKVLFLTYCTMSGQEFNRNAKQSQFNQLRGTIDEFGDGDSFCNIVLKVGHDVPRYVNFIVKKETYKQILSEYKIGDKVCIQYFISSKKKHGKWYTVANFLAIEK